MKNIILIGMPGCGKTEIGKLIATQLNLDFFDCDQHIEASQYSTIPKIFEEHGEQHFRDLETDTLKALLGRTGAVISTGGGVVERPQNIDILKKLGIVVFINRPLEKLLSDIDTTNRPLLKDGKVRLYELFKRRFDLYRSACRIEVLNDNTIENTVKTIISEVTKND